MRPKCRQNLPAQWDKPANSGSFLTVSAVITLFFTSDDLGLMRFCLPC
jgi:hypothetical protein